MFKKIVNIIEVATLAVAVVCVALMLTYRPAKPAPASATGGPIPSGATIFASSCASCHGGSGEGQIGPKLAGGAVVRAFPDPAAQIAIVTKGRGGMPAWAGRLTPAEIRAVVDYTRTKL